jgi:hypothetical protein
MENGGLVKYLAAKFGRHGDDRWFVPQGSIPRDSAGVALGHEHNRH